MSKQLSLSHINLMKCFQYFNLHQNLVEV
uniref:Uncharacterized protein n=1 Tax=Arundo donax TaxID=35708 RepID=A0A0A9GQK2_ARUDO